MYEERNVFKVNGVKYISISTCYKKSTREGFPLTGLRVLDLLKSDSRYFKILIALYSEGNGKTEKSKN